VEVICQYMSCVKLAEIDGDFELGRSLRDPTVRADKWIVVTTIRSPTDAVRALAQQPGWKVVVVGDKKTPRMWRHVLFLSCLFCIDVMSAMYIDIVLSKFYM